MKTKKQDVIKKCLYHILVEIDHDQEKIQKIQELTLDNNSLSAGLNGTYGLYGSQEWVDNLKNKMIPRKYIKGGIQEICAIPNMDNDRKPNHLKIKVDHSKELFCI